MTQKVNNATNKATAKTASSTIKITLTDDITFAGNTAAKGETIEVDKVTVQWLIKLGKAKKTD